MKVFCLSNQGRCLISSRIVSSRISICTQCSPVLFIPPPDPIPSPFVYPALLLTVWLQSFVDSFFRWPTLLKSTAWPLMPPRKRKSSDDEDSVPSKRLKPSLNQGRTTRRMNSGRQRRNPPQIKAEELQSHIQSAIETSLAAQYKEYDRVRCMLVSWKTDHFQCKNMILNLKSVFEDQYGYETTTFDIPDSRHPVKKLFEALHCLTFDLRENDLCILYYFGHTWGNNHPLDNIRWTSGMASTKPGHENSSFPELNWTYLQQTVMDRSHCDVLMIMDTCLGARAIRASKDVVIEGRKEIIASAGWEHDSRGFNFTNCLMHELKKLAEDGEPFSTGQLFSKMVREMKGPAGATLRETPFHAALNCKDASRQIMLRPKLKADSSTSGECPVKHRKRMVVTLPIDFPGNITPAQKQKEMAEWFEALYRKEARHIHVLQVLYAALSMSGLIIFTVPLHMWEYMSTNPAMRPCGIITGPSVPLPLTLEDRMSPEDRRSLEDRMSQDHASTSSNAVTPNNPSASERIKKKRAKQIAAYRRRKK